MQLKVSNLMWGISNFTKSFISYIYIFWQAKVCLLLEKLYDVNE